MADTRRRTALDERHPDPTGATSAPTTSCGRMNLLTPEKVLQGVAEVQEGLTFCLSLPLDYPGGKSSIRAATRRCCGRPCATAGRT